MDGARRCVRIARCTNTPNGGWLLGVRLGPGGLIGGRRRIACPYPRPSAPLLSAAGRLGAVVPLCALQMQGLRPRHHGTKLWERGDACVRAAGCRHLSGVRTAALSASGMDGAGPKDCLSLSTPIDSLPKRPTAPACHVRPASVGHTCKKILIRELNSIAGPIEEKGIAFFLRRSFFHLAERVFTACLRAPKPLISAFYDATRAWAARLWIPAHCFH